MKVHKCLAGCGKTITWQFAMCSDCEKTYGSSPYHWPEWLRYLWRSTQRERRQTARVHLHEVPMDMSELMEYDTGGLSFVDSD